MRDTPTHVTGGCLCGKVRYEAEVFLKSAFYCHCRMCQKSSGQPAELGVPIKAGTLVFTASEPKYFQSSKYGRRAFCDNCGSRIGWRALDPENDWLTNVSVGSLDNSSEARPAHHTFIDTRLPWYTVDEQLPEYKEEEVEALLRAWKEERDLPD
jgi:hypothetical protein